MHQDTFDNGNPTPLSTGNRWTPVRKGDVFCSPACGYKCKWADYQSATASAAALVAELGDGWHPHIWENGGWYYSAKKGAATVDYVERKGHFDAEIMAGNIQFMAEGSTPRGAMEAALAKIVDKVAALNRAMQSASLEPLAMKAT
jgi:hypothetical protein